MCESTGLFCVLSPKHTREYTHTDNSPISPHLPFSVHQLLCSFLIGECAVLVRMMRTKRLMIQISKSKQQECCLLQGSSGNTWVCQQVCSELHTTHMIYALCILCMYFLYAWITQITSYNRPDMQYTIRVHYIDKKMKLECLIVQFLTSVSLSVCLTINSLTFWGV